MRTVAIPTPIGPLQTRNGWPSSHQLETLLIEALRRRGIGMKGNPVRFPLGFKGTRRSILARSRVFVSARVVLYTHRNEIGIYASIERKNSAMRRPFWKTYLAGDMSGRRCEPGEGWQRGCDLPDGSMDADVLESILEAALQMELAVPPHPHEKLLDEPPLGRRHGKRLPH